jgi:hypothetical protein
MSLSDIFTPSVVISLAISLLLIGLLGLYVSNKMSEQNHKLNTMFDLVSTLANELQMVRSQPPVGMASPSMGGGGGSGGGSGGRVYERPEVANTNHLVNMIDVSDESDSSGDESDGETDEGAESDDDSGSDDDGEGECEGEGECADDGEDQSGSDGDDDESDGDGDGDSDCDGENDARSDKAIVVSESLDDALFEELANLDDIVLEETNIERVKTPETTTTTSAQTNTNSVKNLNVVFDYKKASLGKLREIVEQKGLSSDTSKLKKQELLKLLEID